jgi:predicted nucleic acid-binding protein
MYFVDSSALLKAYISEDGTPAVVAALDNVRGAVYVSSAVVIETAAAMARLRRTGRMRQKTYAKAREQFLDHCRTRYHVVHPPDAVVITTLGMIDTYRMRTPGGFDLLHLATAEYIQKLRPGRISLICCDAGLRNVAEERGFEVVDPLRDPLPGTLRPPGEGEGQEQTSGPGDPW